MPRFSAAFARRKSAATPDEFQDVDLAAPQRPVSTFRVLERNDYPNGRSFDGGARMARASTTPIARPGQPDHNAEDNMFADLKTNNRDSGASHTTKGTSTDNSSRHSNTSTAPSSAEMNGGHAPDDHRVAAGKKPLNDVSGRTAQKSAASGFLDRAGRTFSFGVQKKKAASPPQDDGPSDVPPVPNRQYDDEHARSRGMTASTSSTVTPPKLEGESGSGFDLGGDFGSMFTSFDKRASNSTLKALGSSTPRALTGNHPGYPAPLNIDKSTPVAPAPQSWNSQSEYDELLGPVAASPEDDRPPPVPDHRSHLERQASRRPTDIGEDEDAKLFQDSLLAGRFLAGSDAPRSGTQYGRRRTEEESFTVMPRKPIASSFTKGDDNMFDSSMSRFTRSITRQPPQLPKSSQNKVMTTAEFEKYRQDKERQERLDKANKVARDDDEDEIDYDEEEEDDDAERAKKLAKQRRQQQAHMAVYRQQMMKVTGEPAMPSPPPSTRPTLSTSMSAPHITARKSPSPDPSAAAADDDSDEEVPLAILQAHGFPNKNRPPTLLGNSGSNPNLRGAAAAAAQPPRPGSSVGEASTSGHQRHSTVPAFARGLPKDPFVGAGISKPAVRESLSFGGGSRPNQSNGPLPPGGLVGVIADEERSRAMRRGSPGIDNQKLMNGGAIHGQGAGFDPAAGIPHNMMYPGGRNSMMPDMQGVPHMPQQPALSAGDQAQIQMTQQMQQFMQMQMQFMQMMASNQGGGAAPPMQQPYGGGVQGSQSMADLSGQSMMGDPMGQPRPLDHSSRTMSMVHPPGMHPQPQHGLAPSIHVAGPGYSPSIAPSERSNVGLPGRYRPVSQASSPAPGSHQRSNTMSGALSQWDDGKDKSSLRVVSREADGSDDDDDEGWEAMKAARDQRMAQRKSKKTDFLTAGF